MKSKKNLFGVILMLGLFTSMSASAGPFYRIAYRAANGLADSAWLNLGQDCTKTSVFIQMVGEGVDDAAGDIGTKYRGRTAEDFAAGYMDGLVVVLDKVVTHCERECRTVGMAAGEWSAKFFCRLAKVIRGTPTYKGISNLRGSLCGGSYRMGCESNFVGITTGRCPQYATGSKFDRYYRARYNGCCSYDPLDY